MSDQDQVQCPSSPEPFSQKSPKEDSLASGKWIELNFSFYPIIFLLAVYQALESVRVFQHLSQPKTKRWFVKSFSWSVTSTIQSRWGIIADSVSHLSIIISSRLKCPRPPLWSYKESFLNCFKTCVSTVMSPYCSGNFSSDCPAGSSFRNFLTKLT